MATTGKKKTQSLEEFFVTEVGVKLWIERVLNVRLPNYFLPELKDGILLCRLMLELRERSIPEIYGFDSSSSSSSDSSSSSSGQELPFYLTKNNIQFFLAACEEEFHLSKSVLLLPSSSFFLLCPTILTAALADTNSLGCLTSHVCRMKRGSFTVSNTSLTVSSQTALGQAQCLYPLSLSLS